MDAIRKALDNLKQPVGEVRSQSVRLPRWALIAVGITTIAILGEVAFLVVQSSGDGGGQAAEEEQLPCNRRVAERVVEGGRFEREVRDLGTVPPLAEVPEIYDPDLVGCTDLTGDGIEEMVVQLTEIVVGPPPAVETASDEAEGDTTTGETTAAETMPEETTTATTTETVASAASGTARPWAIYRVEDGEWSPALMRTHVPGTRLTVEEDRVREITGALALGDALCCPTGHREGTVRWKEDRFIYRPAGGLDGRTIALADEQPVSISGFDLQEESLVEAIELFGPPTTYVAQGDVCPASWDDLGLGIEFFASGELDPCGTEGRVRRLSVTGVEAEHFGWKTDEGATVGLSKDELRVLYPEMAEVEETTLDPDRPEGRLFALVGSTVETSEGAAPTLSARIDGGKAVAFELSVGAGG